MPTLTGSILRERTYELLRNRPMSLTLLEIATATGIKQSWLNHFQQKGLTMSASVDRIEALYNFLADKKLTIK